MTLFPISFRNRSLAATLVLAAVTAGALPARAEPAVYKLDPSHTSIAFKTHHLGFSEVVGQFLTAEGSFTYDAETNSLSQLDVTIDPASVFSNDKARDGHLRGKDFLNVASFPAITFILREAKAEDASHGTVTGDLTLLGVTRPVTLDVTLNKAGDYPFAIDGKIPYVLGISAETSLKRSDFGMTYAVDNGWVGDEIEVFLSFEAVRQ